MRPWTHVCNIARLRAMPAAIPPAVSRFLSVHSIVSGGGGPVCARVGFGHHAPYSGIPTVLAPRVYPENHFPCRNRPRVDRLGTSNGLVLKPQRDIPYDVVAFRGENKVSPLSDRNGSIFMTYTLREPCENPVKMVSPLKVPGGIHHMHRATSVMCTGIQ